MATQVALDESDRQLVLRCRKGQEYWPGTEQVARMMFWLFSAIWCLALMGAFAILLIRGPEAVPSNTASALFGGFLWTGLWWCLYRMAGFDRKLIRLVRKLTDESAL